MNSAPGHRVHCMCEDCLYPPGETEAARVEGWRLHTLIEAGYPVALAERLTPRVDIDLHRAVELVAQGCLPELAAEILL